MDYSVVLSPSARRDLRDIVRYISLDSPERAESFGAFLISQTRLLAKFPEMGREVPEIGMKQCAKSLSVPIAWSINCIIPPERWKLRAFGTAQGERQN